MRNVFERVRDYFFDGFLKSLIEALDNYNKKNSRY